jgi:outer membrane protein OmpA-like peptidoglycan-associated protein
MMAASACLAGCSLFGPAPVPQPPPTYIVFFRYDSAELSQAARQIVDQAAARAKVFHPSTITIAGYTDQSGTPDANRHLSDRRIATVEQALGADGVDPKLFLRLPLPDQPTALEPTADRRIEIRLTPPGQS